MNSKRTWQSAAILSMALAFTLPTTLFADDAPPADNARDAVKKLKLKVEKKPVAYSGEWLHEYEKAVAISTALGRPILADFTGSDWCPPCKMLTRDVFGSEDFKAWAKENVVLLELDFPRNKQLAPQIKAQNQKLQQKFQVRGYPTIVIMDSEGKELGRHVGGMNDPERFIGIVKPFVGKYEAVEGGGNGALVEKKREVDPT